MTDAPLPENPVKLLKSEIRHLETILEIVPDNTRAPAENARMSLTDTGCDSVRRNLETCIKNLKGLVYEMAGEV